MAPNPEQRDADAPYGEQPQSHDAPRRDEEPRETPRTTFAQLGQLVAELREYASYFLSTRIDAAKVSMRKALIYAVLAIIALIVAATALIVAVALFLTGAAAGLGHLFGDRLWLGNLVMGLLVLLATAIGTIVVASMLTRSSRRKTVMKYEQRQQWQFKQFGRNLDQAAAAKAE